MPTPEVEGSPTPWVADLRYQILDLTVGVRCSDPAVAARLEELLHSFSSRRSGPVPPQNVFSLVESQDRQRWRLSRGGNLLAESEAWAPLIGVLVAEVNTSAVGEMRCFAAHAGVVADADGVLAFPAQSGGGKSTFTAACLLAGFDYVSDEALCLAFEDGEVVPYPKPISLSPWSLQALGLQSSPQTATETLLSPRDLGSVAVQSKMPLRAVVLMERSEGDPELSELPRSEAVASLLRASFNHYKWPEESFRLLTKLAPSCWVWKLRFDKPMPAARMLRDRMGRLS